MPAFFFVGPVVRFLFEVERVVAIAVTLPTIIIRLNELLQLLRRKHSNFTPRMHLFELVAEFKAPFWELISLFGQRFEDFVCESGKLDPHKVGLLFAIGVK